MENEKKYELENHNYLTLCGWMVNDLKLTGNELIVYAVIFTFSQDKVNWCYASKEYLANWLGASTKTVGRVLDSLIEKGLITKRLDTDRTGKYNIYKAHRKPAEGMDNLSSSYGGGYGQSVMGVGTICPGGMDNLSKHTIYDNKDNIKDYREGDKSPDAPAKKRFVKPTVEEIASYCSENNYSLNAQYFFDFYESKGWKVGTSPMKDWKCAVRNWVNRDRKSNPVRTDTCGNNNPKGFKDLF